MPQNGKWRLCIKWLKHVEIKVIFTVIIECQQSRWPNFKWRAWPPKYRQHPTYAFRPPTANIYSLFINFVPVANEQASTHTDERWWTQLVLKFVQRNQIDKNSNNKVSLWCYQCYDYYLQIGTSWVKWVVGIYPVVSSIIFSSSFILQTLIPPHSTLCFRLHCIWKQHWNITISPHGHLMWSIWAVFVAKLCC